MSPDSQDPNSPRLARRHASGHARVSSSRQDRDVSGDPLNRQVPGRAIWDVHCSKAFGERVRLTVGAFNVTD